LAAVQTVATTGTSNNKVPAAATGNTTKPTYEELEKRYAALEAKLKVAEAANQEIQNVNDNLAKRMDAMELEKKREKIVSIVQEAAYEDMEAKIDDFIQSGLPLERISGIVAPMVKANKAKTKQASVTGGQEYASSVAIRNEGSSSAESANGRREAPAWASNYLDVLNGGGSA